MRKLAAYINRKYTRTSNLFTAQYQRALRYIGIEDCPEMRITAAVTVSIALYYVCAVIQAIADVFSASGHTLTALVTG
mgnify:CR=1 FL=1